MTGVLAAPRPPATITIDVLGTPAPQGSKRAFMGKRKDGSTYQGVVESSHDRVKSWRQAVIDAAAEAKGGMAWRPLTGPLAVSVTFGLKRPRSHYRTGRNAHLLRDSAPVRPDRMPDLSKLIRSTEDALTDAGIWADDGQVASIIASKLWAGDPDDIGVYPPPLPGAHIYIAAVT